LLASYSEPAIAFDELQRLGVFGGHPPQSIFEISAAKLRLLLPRLNLTFST
jgi:hypothetical protein